MEKRFEFASIPMALKNAGYALTGWLESGVVPGGKPVLHNQEIKPVALKKVPTGQIRNMLYKINDDNRTDGKRPEYGPVRLGFFPLGKYQYSNRSISYLLIRQLTPTQLELP